MYTALKMIADFKRSCNGKAKPMPPEIATWRKAEPVSARVEVSP